MPSVIDRRTLLWRLMRCTQKYPLLRRRHLITSFRETLRLQFDCQTIQFHAELSKMLVLPNLFILGLRWGQDRRDVRRISLYCLLNPLLDCEGAVHLLEWFVRPFTKLLQLPNISYIRTTKFLRTLAPMPKPNITHH
jgi:hypothetical protein